MPPQNQDAGRSGHGVGARASLFGKASNYRTWELGAAYQVIEKDALFAQLIDSDFAGGVVRRRRLGVAGGLCAGAELDAERHVLPQQAQPGRAELGRRRRDVDYDRLQLDFNVKF